MFKIKVVVLLLRTHFRSLDCAYSSSHHSDLICLHFRVWQIKTPQMLLKLREGERKRFVFVNGFTSQCTDAVVRTHHVFILPFSEWCWAGDGERWCTCQPRQPLRSPVSHVMFLYSQFLLNHHVILLYWVLCVWEQEEKAPKEEAGSPKVRSFFCCSSRSTKDQEVTCKNHPTKHAHRMHNLDVLKKKEEKSHY